MIKKIYIMAKKIKDLGLDYDISSVKVSVPNSALQMITNDMLPIKEGYIVSFMDDFTGVVMTHTKIGTETNIRMIEVFPNEEAKEIQEWEIVE